MKKILLNTKTYIGPLGDGNIDFYSIYKNQLYIISENKFKYLLDYLKIKFPEKEKIGFNVSTWLRKKNLLNENLLSEISSTILNVPNDFSESDVYYYLSNKKERKNILTLFEESLKNAYIYAILIKNKDKFISAINNFFNMNSLKFDIIDFIRDFKLYFFSDNNYLFAQEIKNFKIPVIILKDKFFFERMCKYKDVVCCNTICKQYFFPKRNNLEFLSEEFSGPILRTILKNMEIINNKRINFERKLFKKKFSIDEMKVFKHCINTNFSFIDFEMIIFLILFVDENFNIKVDNMFCNFLDKKELLNYFTNVKFSFITNNNTVLEPKNYAKIKLNSF